MDPSRDPRIGDGPLSLQMTGGSHDLTLARLGEVRGPAPSGGPVHRVRRAAGERYDEREMAFLDNERKVTLR
jgi:hypothetical protein